MFRTPLDLKMLKRDFWHIFDKNQNAIGKANLKTYLISPACYQYLQHMPCLSLPHFNPLEKLYSSFGHENEFFPFLRKATCSFSNEQKHVIFQMNEITHKTRYIIQGRQNYRIQYVQIILRKLYLLSWSLAFRKNGPALFVCYHVQLYQQRRYLQLLSLIF